jgi:hypothetical protein
MPSPFIARTTNALYKLGNRTDISVPLTASGTLSGAVATVVPSVPGTGYQVGDVLLPIVTPGTGVDAIFQVTAINPTGGIVSLNIIQQGGGYTAGTLPTSDGNGTGATVTITVVTFTAPSRINLWQRDAYINLMMSNRFPGTEGTVTFTTVQGKAAYNYSPLVRAVEALTYTGQMEPSLPVRPRTFDTSGG